jgi:SAM-dependent methyltransferase
VKQGEPRTGPPSLRRYVLGVANEKERGRWNDERWTSAWPKREALTSAVSPYLLNAVAALPGHRVIDVGCGGGGISISVARSVGSGGRVVGVDISTALLELARARATEARLDNLTFVRADMQTDDIDGRPFDLAVSQFGVMFFDEPVTAFASILHQLREGGRLVFAAWQEVERNPWHIGTALQPVVPPPRAPQPGKSMTGPFTLGDIAQTSVLLERAGFTDVTATPFEVITRAPASAIVDRSLFTFMGVRPEQMDEASAITQRHLDRFRVDDDEFDFPLAFNVVGATVAPAPPV